MTEQEIQEVLDQLHKVKPELLNEQGKRLFETIMKIADERDDLQDRVNKAIEYCNNNIEFTQRLVDIINILLN